MLLLPERLTLKPVSRPRPYGDRRFWNVFYKDPDWEKPRFVGVLEVFNSPRRQTYSVQAGDKREQAEVEDRGRPRGD